MSPLSPDRTPQRSRSWIRRVIPLTLLPRPDNLRRSMTVFLVRHADAKSRANWPGDDVDRPLTRKGEAQAWGLVDLLHHSRIKRILSSPAVRCIETVKPLASKVGVPVKDT